MYEFPSHMFWGKLTKAEAESHASFIKFSGTWLAWAALKDKVRNVTPEPDRPTDAEWIEDSRICNKGWAL